MAICLEPSLSSTACYSDGVPPNGATRTQGDARQQVPPFIGIGLSLRIRIGSLRIRIRIGHHRPVAGFPSPAKQRAETAMERANERDKQRTKKTHS